MKLTSKVTALATATVMALGALPTIATAQAIGAGPITAAITCPSGQAVVKISGTNVCMNAAIVVTTVTVHGLGDRSPADIAGLASANTAIFVSKADISALEPAETPKEVFFWSGDTLAAWMPSGNVTNIQCIRGRGAGVKASPAVCGSAMSGVTQINFVDAGTDMKVMVAPFAGTHHPNNASAWWGVSYAAETIR